MLAVAPSWVVDAGIIAGSTTAVITLLTVGVKSPVGRWVIRNIRDEWREHREEEMRRLLDEAVPRHVMPILAELRPNGGSSFRDEVNGFIREQHAKNRELLDAASMARTQSLMNTDRIVSLEADVRRVLDNQEGNR